MPSLSVVIPCFNAAPYIAETLRSVMSQSVPPDEIIVVDDGSTDGSADIVADFAAPVRLLRQVNAGVAAARNRGVAAGSGALLGFIDADDIWPTESVALRLEVMEREDVDMAFGAVQNCRGEAGPSAPRLGPPVVGRVAGSILLRRAFVDRIGPFDESLRSAETIEWIARAARLAPRSAGTDAIVLYRRVHMANMMRDESVHVGRRFGVLRDILKRQRDGGAG